MQLSNPANPANPTKVIDSFSGEYRFLSNFYWFTKPRTKIQVTVEHLYQCAKCVDKLDASTILMSATPGEAKRLGRGVRIRTDWEMMKLSIMYALVLTKFRAEKELADKLLATGDAMLIEGNNWGDRFWGMVRDKDGQWEGENRLGKILMQVREEIRHG